MRSSLLVVLGVVLVGGCTSVKEVYLPDGREGHALNCSGAKNDWGGCMKKAGQICKSAGYDVYMRNHETGQISGVSYSANMGLQGASSTVQGRELVIGCK